MLVAQLVRSVFFSQLVISHVLNGPTAKNQHRCKGPSAAYKDSKHKLSFFIFPYFLPMLEGEKNSRGSPLLTQFSNNMVF